MQTLHQPKFHAALLGIAIAIGLVLGLSLHLEWFHSASHLVTEYLLPLFFVAVGIELRAEFKTGYFANRRNIAAPTLAAVLGVAGPALTFLVVTGEVGGSWAIPTATDITLGVAALSYVSVNLATRLRAKFLALATIDDVIGLVILLAVFSSELNPLRIGAVLLCAALFYFVQTMGRPPVWISLILLLAGVILAVGSGVQTSLIGFLFGFLVSIPKQFRWLHLTNGLFVLPVFGLAIGALSGSALGSGISLIVLTGILLRPIGKLAGIVAGSLIAGRIFGTSEALRDWVAIGLLGGLGLTVSLLIAQIAYSDKPASLGAAVVGTLIASMVSIAFFFLMAKFLNQPVRLDEK